MGRADSADLPWICTSGDRLRYVCDDEFSVFDAIKGPVELTAEMSLQEMEGQYVSYEVKYPLGTYMEETVTKR